MGAHIPPPNARVNPVSAAAFTAPTQIRACLEADPGAILPAPKTQADRSANMPAKPTPRPQKPAKSAKRPGTVKHGFVTTPVPKPAPFAQTYTKPRSLGTSMR
jgi:hypothetical protein